MSLFKIIGIRSKLGKVLIADAMASFDKAAKKLEAGVRHCQVDVTKHQASISESQDKIQELNQHIERGNRVAAKLRDFTK